MQLTAKELEMIESTVRRLQKPVTEVVEKIKDNGRGSEAKGQTDLPVQVPVLRIDDGS